MGAETCTEDGPSAPREAAHYGACAVGGTAANGIGSLFRIPVNHRFKGGHAWKETQAPVPALQACRAT